MKEEFFGICYCGVIVVKPGDDCAECKRLFSRREFKEYHERREKKMTGKKCGNCVYYKGKLGDDTGPCNFLSTIMLEDSKCKFWKAPEPEEFINTKLYWGESGYYTDIHLESSIRKVLDFPAGIKIDRFRVVGFLFEDNNLHHDSPIHIYKKSEGGWEVCKATHALWQED